MRNIRALTVAAFLLCASNFANSQEPGWASNVVTPEPLRATLEATPIVYRLYRPFHFYGNTVRRIYYRGTAMPAPVDFRMGARALLRRPYVSLDEYIR